MGTKIEKFINKMNFSKERIVFLTKYLEDKKIEYENATRSQKEELHEHQCNSSVVRFCNWSVSIGELVDEIAAIENIDSKDIEVALCIDDYITDINFFPNATEEIKKDPRGWQMCLHLECAKADTEVIDLVQDIDPFAEQADGKPLIEHLKEVRLKSPAVRYRIYRTGFEFVDTNPIIFDVPFLKMVNEIDNQYKLNLLGKAINNIARRKELESEMGE